MELLTHILMVDDDLETTRMTAMFLKRHGYQVSILADPSQVMDFLLKTPVDLIIIDMFMPNINGLVLSKTIKTHYQIPIIMLTGVEEAENKIIALETNIDDYLTKPLSLRVLLAHIHALLRRKRSVALKPSNIYYFSGWQFDKTKRILIAPNHEKIVLSAQLEILLQFFIEHCHQVHRREVLLEALKKNSTSFDERRVDSLISQLRQIFCKYQPDNTLLQTIRTQGYRFNSDVTTR